MRRRKEAVPGKYYASVTGAKDTADESAIMVFFDTKDKNGVSQGTTMLFVNDLYFKDPKKAQYKFMDSIGMLNEDGDIEPDTIFQKSKDKEYIVMVEETISRSGVYYNVSDIAVRKKKSGKASKAAEDNEQ